MYGNSIAGSGNIPYLCKEQLEDIYNWGAKFLHDDLAREIYGIENSGTLYINKELPDYHIDEIPHLKYNDEL